MEYGELGPSQEIYNRRRFGAKANLIDLRLLRQQPHWESSSLVQHRLQGLLAEPSCELLARPSHQFRAQLVTIGWQLAHHSKDQNIDPQQLSLCAEAIEYLHLGSLVVDDIQDGSDVRRSGPALHRVLGTPHALAVGNWLYFHALATLDRLQLPSEAQLQLFRNFHKMVELAHYGQVLDVCIKVDRVEDPAELAALCDACLHYKTGAIVALAMLMGACLTNTEPTRLQAIESLGMALGAYLQRLNDLGNLLGGFDEDKKLEDMVSKKPSFVWAFVVEQLGKQELDSLQAALARLPQEQPLQQWLAANDFKTKAQAWIEQDFEESLTDFMQATKMQEGELSTLLHLKNRIQKAYV